MAYRCLPEVIAQHAGTVKVLHTLRPFAVAMAGEGEFDPFKDYGARRGSTSAPSLWFRSSG